MATIFDVYIANALARLGMTDIVPIGQDPGGTPADGAINAEDFISQILTTTTSYKIATSITSDDLVVELTHLDDGDPTTDKPLWIKIKDEWLKFTAAVSLTIADGTNWANLGGAELATQDVDLFAYIVKETGASAGNKLAWSRIPYGQTVGDFSSTNTSEKYLAGPTNHNATDKVVNIGRFNATLSAGAGYTWTIPATSIIINNQTLCSRWLEWAPVFTGFATDPIAAGSYWHYMIEGALTTLNVSCVSGVSNAASFYLTIPFLSAYLSHVPIGAYQDNATFNNSGGTAKLTAASNVCSLFLPGALSDNWTAANGKAAWFQMYFEI